MLYVELFLVGISLSIDAFSLALSVGLNGNFYKKNKLYSVVVGIFHFFMTIFGFILRTFINKVVEIPNKEIFIIVILFVILGIIFDKSNNKKTFINPFVFGFSVSIDSFSIGITLNKSIVIISSIMFSLLSASFTYIGFKIAKKIKNKFEKNSKFLSISILLAILIYNILK